MSVTHHVCDGVAGSWAGTSPKHCPEAPLQVSAAGNLIPASAAVAGSVQDSQPRACATEKYRRVNTCGQLLPCFRRRVSLSQIQSLPISLVSGSASGRCQVKTTGSTLDSATSQLCLWVKPLNPLFLWPLLKIGYQRPSCKVCASVCFSPS